MHSCSVKCRKLHTYSTITFTRQQEHMQNQPISQAVKANTQRRAPNAYVACAIFSVVLSKMQPLQEKSIMCDTKRGIRCLSWTESRSGSQDNSSERCLLCLQHVGPTCQSCFCDALKNSAQVVPRTVCKCTSWVQAYLAVGRPCWLLNESLFFFVHHPTVLSILQARQVTIRLVFPPFGAQDLF